MQNCMQDNRKDLKVVSQQTLTASQARRLNRELARQAEVVKMTRSKLVRPGRDESPLVRKPAYRLNVIIQFVSQLFLQRRER